MLYYEIQAPSSGDRGEMRMKGSMVTPAIHPASQTSGDPRSPSREMWGRQASAVSGDKRLSVSLGCRCRPRQGSNNQDYVQGKGTVEPSVRRSHSTFSTPDIYQDDGSVEKAEPGTAGRPRGTKPHRLQSCRLGRSL